MNKRFRSLELVARRYLDSFSSGIHATLLKDSLIEVDVVREYQPGDKRLDSKASLKTGKTMSRVFNPERSLNLFIVLDISSSQFTKLDAAVTTALYLCYLGDICSEKIGICVFSDKVLMTDVTEDYSMPIGLIEKSLNNLGMGKKTGVEQGISQVSSLGLQNSLVVFISDFCYPLSDKLSNNIKRIALTPTNTFLSVVLHNPNDWLISLNHNFQITFKDAETGKIGEYDAISAKEDFSNWGNDLKTKLLQCNSEVVFLNVKQNNFLLPLIKHLMRN